MSNITEFILIVEHKIDVSFQKSHHFKVKWNFGSN